MKTITTLLTSKVTRLACVVALLGFSSVAFGKADYKKALGLSACTDCHIQGKMKEPNPSNAMWKSAKEMAEKTAKGEGEYAGKSCMDCHQGKSKPEKK